MVIFYNFLNWRKRSSCTILGSLQAVIASFISAFTAVWNIKEKLKYVCYILFPSLTSNVFVLELDIMNVNVTSRISLYL